MSELADLVGKRFYSCPDCCTLARRVQRLEGAHDTLMAVIETHKPTCSQCGQPWTEGKTVCGFDHLEIRAAIEARAALAEEAE